MSRNQSDKLEEEACVLTIIVLSGGRIRCDWLLSDAMALDLNTKSWYDSEYEPQRLDAIDSLAEKGIIEPLPEDWRNIAADKTELVLDVGE